MARSRASDFIQNYRFRLTEATGTFIATNTGFSDVSTPDMSLAVVEYRDGQTLFTLKQPGLPTVGNVAMKQGTTEKTSQFNAWIQDAAIGNEYRADLSILVYKNVNDPKAPVSKQIDVAEAFPIRNKIFADLAAKDAEISIRELECACEQVTEIT